MTLSNKKLAILGVGNMGNALLKGILKASPVAPKDVIVTARSEARLVAAREEFGVGSTTNNTKAVEFADIVLLCTKPQGIEDLAKEIQPAFDSEKLLISILAGRTTKNLEDMFGTTTPIMRAMPNIPSMVDEGATAICAGSYATEEHQQATRAIFSAVGEVVDVAEYQMDAVTGLSGSGPAYIYMIIEALTDGGVKMGLPRDTAIKLATQTVLGSAKLVKETGLHPAILRDQVTTPGGTAIAAIHDLEDHGLRPMLISAVVTATEKSKELGD